MDQGLSFGVVDILHRCEVFFVEHTARAIAFCKSQDRNFDPATKQWISLHEGEEQARLLLRPFAEQHKQMAIMSDAGLPCVADTGYQLVAEAHILGIPIVPLVGASSIMLALMSSGLNGQRFMFQGYLPIDKIQRKNKIVQFEKWSHHEKSTQIFIETPYRNQQLLGAFLQYLSPSTQLCIASNILSKSQFIKTQSIEAWRAHPPNVQKHNTIFLFEAM